MRSGPSVATSDHSKLYMGPHSTSTPRKQPSPLDIHHLPQNAQPLERFGLTVPLAQGSTHRLSPQPRQNGFDTSGSAAAFPKARGQPGQPTGMSAGGIR